jgi:hypothetical protein
MPVIAGRIRPNQIGSVTWKRITMAKLIARLVAGRDVLPRSSVPDPETSFAGLRPSAALNGCGSEILGFDTQRRTDHSWGPPIILDAEHRYHSVASQFPNRLGSQV